MKMTGEEHIAAPRQRVWEALNDAGVLRQCIPGCQSLDKESDERLKAVVAIKIGPIGARFNGAVSLSDISAPNGYTITGEGQGGTVGFAKGGAKVRLRDDGAGTMLSYEVDAEVGGRLAQLGGPIIDVTARQLAGKFFRTFGEVVGGAVAEPAGAAPHAAPVRGPVPVLNAAPLAASASFPWGWIAALALAVVAGFLLGRSPAADWWVVAVVILVMVAAGAGYVAGRSGSRP